MVLTADEIHEEVVDHHLVLLLAYASRNPILLGRGGGVGLPPALVGHRLGMLGLLADLLPGLADHSLDVLGLRVQFRR